MATQNFNIKNINVQTGELDIEIDCTADGAYTQAYGSFPNVGKSASLNLSFEGKLKVFHYENEVVIAD